jgi:hypothetical protein
MPASSDCSGEVLNPIVIEVARACLSESRAQRGIRADERLRRTPYRGFLRKPGDYLLRPVAYPRLISVMAISRQLLRIGKKRAFST